MVPRRVRAIPQLPEIEILFFLNQQTSTKLRILPMIRNMKEFFMLLLQYAVLLIEYCDTNAVVNEQTKSCVS